MSTIKLFVFWGHFFGHPNQSTSMKFALEMALGLQPINCWVCVNFALKNEANSMHNLYVFISIFICISINSIKLKNISLWVFFCKLAAYFQNNFLEEYF